MKFLASTIVIVTAMLLTTSLATNDVLSHFELIEGNRQRVCHLQPAMGPCRASLIRWRYNPTSERCETFIYGGCLGNENNFSNEMSCLHFCTGQLLAKPPKHDSQ